MVPFYEIQRSDIKIIHNKRELNYPTHIHELVCYLSIGQ